MNQFTLAPEKVPAGIFLPQLPAGNLPSGLGRRAGEAGFERTASSDDRWASSFGNRASVKTLILPVLMLRAGLAGWGAWQRMPRKHDPVEYFAGWDGYGLPIRLTTESPRKRWKRSPRAETPIGSAFDDDNRLVRDVKMLRGEVFFEHVYTYYPSGKLRRVKATNPKGVEMEREYRESARAVFSGSGAALDRVRSVTPSDFAFSLGFSPASCRACDSRS
ncbi:MAG: DUF6156 family protein [Bradyrhizobium sp.]